MFTHEKANQIKDIIMYNIYLKLTKLAIFKDFDDGLSAFYYNVW